MAGTQASPGEVAGWVGRPWAARLVRAVAALAPLPATILSSYVLSHAWPRPIDALPLLLWWLALLGSAVVVSVGVDRVARRLLPLATLLRLSLIFPDETPSRFRVALRSGNAKLLEKRLADLESSKLPGGSSDIAALLLELVTALGTHDRMTRGHSERVRAYATLIGDELGLDADAKNKLQWAALLHDVGKMAVPAELLNKVDPLTDDEFATIRRHPAAAERMLAPLAGWLGEWRFAATQHHERFDGQGYPAKLRADEITLAARIVAVADSFDVITTARSYKTPHSHEAARQELARCAGSQFDPAIVRAFLAVSVGSLRRRMLPVAWLAQLSYLRPAVTSTLALSTGITGAALGFAMAPAAAADTAGAPAAPPVTTIATTVAPGSLGATTVVVAGGRPAGSTPAATVDDPPTTSATTTAPLTPDASPAPTPGGSVGTSPAATGPTPADGPGPAPATSTPAGTAPLATKATTTAAPPTTAAAPTPCDRLRSGETKLAAATLAACDLSGMRLTGTDLTGADLTGANLQNATIDQASFNGARLAGADLRGAHLTAAGFDHADLTNARLDGVWADQVGFAGAVLRGARLSGMFLSRGNLVGADLTGAIADHLQFGGVDLSDAILTRVVLDYSNLSGTRLTRTAFSNASMVSNDLRGAVVTGANFSSAKLDGSDLSGASGAPASATGATWVGATCTSGAVAAPACY